MEIHTGIRSILRLMTCTVGGYAAWMALSVFRADRVQKRHRRRCARECVALYRIRSGHGHWLDYRIQDEVGEIYSECATGIVVCYWRSALGSCGGLVARVYFVVVVVTGCILGAHVGLNVWEEGRYGAGKHPMHRDVSAVISCTSERSPNRDFLSRADEDFYRTRFAFGISYRLRYTLA